MLSKNNNPLNLAINTKGKLPDRRYEVTRYDNGHITLKPHDDGCGVYPGIECVTFRTWIVGDDGLTDIERELENARQSASNP